jgi:oxygen-independent coproporphyrinogen-3 oxidase
MCDLEVDLRQVCTRYRRSLRDLGEERARLADFAHDGLLRLDGERILVTELGRLAIRSICAVFDRYFAPEAGRHAKAL